MAGVGGGNQWSNRFPRLRLLEELEEMLQGGGQFAALPVDDRHRHGAVAVA